MASDGLDSKDGAPADLIRNYFDEQLPGMGTNVSNKLILEVSSALESTLESGFGETTILSTGYVDSITNDGVTIPCSSSPGDDSVYSSEGQTVNNAFYPPICISSSLDITLTESAFNLNSSSSFDLERTYRDC